MNDSQAVLFDLDDTLVDFQYSRRAGLRAVQELLPALAHLPLEELELIHDEQLHADYLRTLGGAAFAVDTATSPTKGRLRGRPRHTPASSSRTRAWSRALPSCSTPWPNT